MPVEVYAICDECGDAMKEYDTLKDRKRTGFRYGEIVESGEPSFADIDGWTVKAFPDPDDPITIQYEFYCPECSALDGVFDSGDY